MAACAPLAAVERLGMLVSSLHCTALDPLSFAVCRFPANLSLPRDCVALPICRRIHHG